MGFAAVWPGWGWVVPPITVVTAAVGVAAPGRPATATFEVAAVCAPGAPAAPPPPKRTTREAMIGVLPPCVFCLVESKRGMISLLVPLCITIWVGVISVIV